MSSQLEHDFTCSVCHDIFRDPVVLSCAHSFCKDCLESWWNEKPVQKCPVCKQVNSQPHPPRNLVLKNLCETFQLERNRKDTEKPEDLCTLHSEKLKLFCLDHQQPVCVVCLHSKTHTNHKFKPIDEVAQDQREELQECLKTLQEKLKHFEQVKENYDQTADYIKKQSKHTEMQIKEQYKKLHEFLQEQEEARITALREEEEQKSQVMKEKIEALSREISALSDTIRATEEKLRAEDVSFLQNYKVAAERVQQRLLMDDPEMVSGALIDVAKHLGNLTINIWSKMKEMVSYTPVILDPNTAHSELILSEDLTSVRHGEKQKLPDNPERFDSFISVLGSKGFKSKSHSWDVEVGNNSSWRLGVAAKSVKRKEYKQSKMWTIRLHNGKYKAFSPGAQPEMLPIKGKPQQIRVSLDRKKRQLSFYDRNSDAQIHTFRIICTQKLFPYISSRDDDPIKILPEEDDSEDEDDDSDDDSDDESDDDDEENNSDDDDEEDDSDDDNEEDDSDGDNEDDSDNDDEENNSDDDNEEDNSDDDDNDRLKLVFMPNKKRLLY